MSNQSIEKVFKEKLAGKIPPSQASAWSKKPATSVGALTKQAKSMQPQSTPAPQQSTPSSGLAVHLLTKPQSEDYAKWTSWAKSAGVPVDKVFGASATYEGFQTFMRNLSKGRESLPMNATSQDIANYIQEAVAQYVSGTTVTPAKGWGGQSPTTMPTEHVEKKKAPEKPTPKDESTPPWVGKRFTWSFSRRVKTHFTNKDLIASEGFPTTPQELEQYVEDNPGEFKRTTAGNWRAPLGALTTKTSGGAKDALYWCIVLSVDETNTGFIFHYGPEHLYKDK